MLQSLIGLQKASFKKNMVMGTAKIGFRNKYLA